jgi:hypothetical protein
MDDGVLDLAFCEKPKTIAQSAILLYNERIVHWNVPLLCSTTMLYIDICAFDGYTAQRASGPVFSALS